MQQPDVFQPETNYINSRNLQPVVSAKAYEIHSYEDQGVLNTRSYANLFEKKKDLIYRIWKFLDI